MSQYNITFTPQGPLAPDTSSIRAAVLADWQQAFDNTLNPDAATPQGQLITSETAIIADKNDQLLFLSNQFNPDVAEGVWQDALGRIYFLDRKPALPTVVACLCVGLPGVVIPGLDAGAGVTPALVEDATGQQYMCQTSGVIAASGSVTLPFQAVTPGPVECAADTVTRIVTVIAGWDTVNNPAPGVTGQDVESRAAFEQRRRNSVALNGNGSVRAVYANVFDVDGVIDCIVRENVGNTPKNIGAVTLAPHSIYVSVVGGADADIAQAIADRKSAGCDMNGNTSLTVTDAVTGAEQVIRWERPATVRFGVQVSFVVTPSTPTDIEARIRSAVLAVFEGTDASCAGFERVRLGDTVYASRFYAGIIQAGVTDLIGVKLAAPYTGPTSAWGESVNLEINEAPALAAEDIVIIQGN